MSVWILLTYLANSFCRFLSITFATGVSSGPSMMVNFAGSRCFFFLLQMKDLRGNDTLTEILCRLMNQLKKCQSHLDVAFIRPDDIRWSLSLIFLATLQELNFNGGDIDTNSRCPIGIFLHPIKILLRNCVMLIIKTKGKSFVKCAFTLYDIYNFEQNLSGWDPTLDCTNLFCQISFFFLQTTVTRNFGTLLHTLGK